jgi:hypothetical protein
MSENPVIGSQLGNYMIESAIGRGGMSTVYRAVHNRLGTPVAVKVLSPELSEDDAFRERFLREAKMAAGIDHPNVIPIHDTGLSGDSLYIVMRYVSGGDLKTQLVTRGRLDLDQAIDILGPVARALDAAHAHGLVHRDVKPANILLQKSSNGEIEHVYLSDFGVMKHTTSISGLTKTGAMVGTIDYMAPEQIESGEVSPRTDVYALGCLFYHCLTGRVPHHRESEAAVLWAHMKGEFEPASSVRPDIPPGVDAAIGRALAKDPAHRYATCNEFIQACRTAAQRPPETRPPDQSILGPAALAGATVAEPPDTPPHPPPSWQSAGTAGGGTAGGTGGGGAGGGGAGAAGGRGDFAGPPATPVPPAPVAQRPNSNGHNRGGRRLLAGRAWIAGVLVLVVGGIVAAIALSGGGDSGSSTQAGDPFDSKLAPVPTNNVTGNGNATVRLDGRNATVSVDTDGLLNSAVHPMHIHAGGKGECPPASAAHTHGGHQAISTVDGEPFYGPPVAALTNEGDTSKQSILVFSRFPHTGNIRYDRTFVVPQKTATQIRDGQASVIIHGIDYNKNGIYDGVLERSDLNRQLPGETTAPALCGGLAPAAGNGKQNASRGVYTAQLHPAFAASDGWIDVP